jgi:hypothetical protein
MKEYFGWQVFSTCTLFTLITGSVLLAQDPKPTYPSMASLSQYLMSDRDAEIALARSAAPEAISNDAEILVLEKDGYKTAVPGKNGFVCVVERSWMSNFDSSQYWNPRLRGPVCFNPQAARSILPITIKRTTLVLAGHTKSEIMDAMAAEVRNKQLPGLEPGGMSYMMSRAGFLDDSAGHWIPHLMFYTALGVNWGADLPDSPVMLNPQFQGKPEPIDVLMIPAGKWSDGTAAPLM